MKEAFKLMRDRLTSPNCIHEYLLHLAIVYRVLRCVKVIDVCTDPVEFYLVHCTFVNHFL